MACIWAPMQEIMTSTLQVEHSKSSTPIPPPPFCLAISRRSKSRLGYGSKTWVYPADSTPSKPLLSTIRSKVYLLLLLWVVASEGLRITYPHDRCSCGQWWRAMGFCCKRGGHQDSNALVSPRVSDHVSNSPLFGLLPLSLRQNTSRKSLQSKIALLSHFAGRKLGARWHLKEQSEMATLSTKPDTSQKQFLPLTMTPINHHIEIQHRGWSLVQSTVLWSTLSKRMVG